MVDYTKILMPEIWAESGDIVAPDSQKIKDGWAVEAVPRQWWNWMQNRVDNNVVYLLQKGIPEWDADTQYIANKSYVQRTGIVYKAILTGTNQDPVSATTYWVKAFSESTVALEALRSVTPSANTFPYFDSATTATTTALSAFARTLLDDVDAPTMRTTLSAQVAHANLTGLSGVTAATNALPYFTMPDGTMATTPLTAFARTLLDDGDAATMRGTLGLSTGATSTVTTSQFDTTAGRLLKVGDFGLGADTTPDTDPNTITTTRFFRAFNSANMPNLSTFVGLTLKREAGGRASQVVWSDATGAMYWRVANNTGTWGNWVEGHSTANGASTAEAQAGTDDTKWVSPLKTLQAMNKFGIGTKTNITDSLVASLQPAANVLATGIYAYNIGATNAPNGVQAGVVIHVERAGNNAAAPYGAFELAMHGDGITYTSQRDNNTGIWSAWAGTTTLASAVAKSGDTMTGPLRFSGSAQLLAATSDGADNGVIGIGGGGGVQISRGAVVNVFGNEHASRAGALDMYAGAVGTGAITMNTGASGAARLIITPNGQITLNQSDSGNTLTVNGSSYTSNQVSAGGSMRTPYLYGSDVNTGQLLLAGVGGGSAVSAFVEMYGSSHATDPGALRIGGANAASGPSTIRFYSQQVQRMQLLANGRLLIGTGVDNGAGLLQVNGTISVANSVDAASRVTAANGRVVMQSDTVALTSSDPTNAGNLHLWFYNYNGTERGLIYWSNDGTMHIRTGASGEIMNFSNAGCTASGFLKGSQLYAGNAIYQNDGNVNGSVWGGYLSTYIANNLMTYNSLQSQIATQSTTGQLGSYAFLYNNTNTNVTPGGTIGGNDLIWSDTAEGNGGVVGYGTWRAMGLAWNHNATLMLRVA